MRHTTITARDLECLEHMRNVGQLVGDLMQGNSLAPSNIDIYQKDITTPKRTVPAARKWRDIPRADPEIKPDNSYRHYL
ncbi:hypothetical protein LTSEWAN_2024 [Salmonella enterica subsp. enterica serovar Wandsworth str. A4-580]|uniref:Uncharacterized protein n=1 Tax=Salmonella enterica subsp. enterica serovar Wandsworth str. A4-580 TaxID=913086 RepID=G5SAE4_SALET|nr:hypothetical protein LTSEWAN_2024 [Salmonella enterica subsp. enterica serovar Wandsworth str. A4-580]